MSSCMDKCTSSACSGRLDHCPGSDGFELTCVRCGRKAGSCDFGNKFYNDDQLATVQTTTEVAQQNDPVSHPAHYTSGGIETIDAIEAWGLGFHLGNAVKYISRAGKKDPAKTVEDLKKARWYLDREIGRLEAK
jgi:hypothetical protein